MFGGNSIGLILDFIILSNNLNLEILNKFLFLVIKKKFFIKIKL